MMLNAEECWQKVLRKDKSASFFMGVLTTGVYCRTGCPARRPLRSNVRFYATTAEAERDGLRPCKRCKPLGDPAAESNAARMRKVCQYIRRNCDSGEALTLQRL